MAKSEKGLEEIRRAYTAVKNEAASDCSGAGTATAIRRLAEVSLRFLASKCVPVGLVSRVPGKEYFSFARKGTLRSLSRPANREFFLLEPEEVCRQWDRWPQGDIDPELLARTSYTVALAPCLAMELFDRQNKKGPATYFECLIGHIFARELGVNPRKQASLPVEGRAVRLTMDFLFQHGTGPHVHLAVKMSTRERVVQAWAHQRILDGAYGPKVYRGVMVLFSETKLDSRSHEVIEICVPDQWLAYQALLSHFERIYYFDVPARYQALAQDYPGLIQIKRFGEFFREKASVLGF